MFRPFRTLLHKIRSLLWTLDRRELLALERLLCTNEDSTSLATLDLPAGEDLNAHSIHSSNLHILSFLIYNLGSIKILEFKANSFFIFALSLINICSIYK